MVNAGWNLNELRAVGLSLEDIFLQLTGAENKTANEPAAVKAQRPPRKHNHEKRLDYLPERTQELLRLADRLSADGVFRADLRDSAFCTATRDFVRFGFMAQMQGRNMPMNVNEQVIRPLLGLRQHDRAVPDPHDHHAAVRRREEDRHHRAAADLAGPRPARSSSGKWLGALLLYLCVLGMSAINIAMLFAFGKPDWKPILVGYLGLILQGGTLLAIGDIHLHHHQEPDHRRRRHFLRVPAALAAELVYGLRYRAATAQVVNYLSIVTHFEEFAKGVLDSKDVIFYLSMIFFSLFITSRSMESLRWRA